MALFGVSVTRLRIWPALASGATVIVGGLEPGRRIELLTCALRGLSDFSWVCRVMRQTPQSWTSCPIPCKRSCSSNSRVGRILLYLS
jgi:hypothetical protein